MSWQLLKYSAHLSSRCWYAPFFKGHIPCICNYLVHELYTSVVWANDHVVLKQSPTFNGEGKVLLCERINTHDQKRIRNESLYYLNRCNKFSAVRTNCIPCVNCKSQNMKAIHGFLYSASVTKIFLESHLQQSKQSRSAESARNIHRQKRKREREVKRKRMGVHLKMNQKKIFLKIS